jgi:hypothetical protein
VGTASCIDIEIGEFFLGTLIFGFNEYFVLLCAARGLNSCKYEGLFWNGYGALCKWRI